MATALTPADEVLRRFASGERDFPGVSLSGANLRGAVLRGANLRGANLRCAILGGADLREAKMIRTDLGLADVGMADFTGCDLSGADFRGANLKGARFGGATLDGANLRGAELNGANLRASKLVRADLSRADLGSANLKHADLRSVDFRGADLAGANLEDASLQSATLHGADLRGADLTGASLRGANLTDTCLDGTILRNASVGDTVFADVDLSQAIGLDSLEHASPSTIGVDTLTRSLGRIPETFLRGCGLSPWEILAVRQYDRTLPPSEIRRLQEQSLELCLQTPQRKRVQISYSGADTPFVEELRRLLLSRGVFAWVVAHDAKMVVRERQSKLAIHHNVVLLLILSLNSIQRDWVDHELRLARKLEEDLGENVVLPVTLDDSWKTSSLHGRITEKTPEDGILSFAGWENKASMETQFESLLAAMGL